MFAFAGKFLFFFFKISKKVEEPCYVFVCRVKCNLKHVNDKIAVTWMAKLAHFVSLSPTRMSLLPWPADCRHNQENNDISVKISCVVGGELSQHFLLVFLKEHWQAAGKMEVQLLSQKSSDIPIQDRSPTRIKNMCLNHSKTFVSFPLDHCSKFEISCSTKIMSQFKVRFIHYCTGSAWDGERES